MQLPSEGLGLGVVVVALLGGGRCARIPRICSFSPGRMGLTENSGKIISGMECAPSWRHDGVRRLRPQPGLRGWRTCPPPRRGCSGRDSRLAHATESVKRRSVRNRQ